MPNRIRRVLIVFAVWLALANALMWGIGAWGNRRVTRFEVPMTQGRALQLSVGPRMARHFTHAEPSPVAIPQRRTLQIEAWLRPARGRPPRAPIAAISVPTWPLTVLLGGVVLMLLALRYWPSRSASRSDSGR